MGRILLLIEKKRFELNKAIEIFGINDYRTKDEAMASIYWILY